MFRLLIMAAMALSASTAAYSQIPPGGEQGTAPARAVDASAPRPSRLAGVATWAYQLQNALPREIARSPFDMVVVDVSGGATGDGRFAPRDFALMKRKADGGRRFILAYLNIGEAEDYRPYWDNDWVETLALAPGTEELLARGDGRPRPLAQRLGRLSTGPAVAGGSATRPALLRVPQLTAPKWLGREKEAGSGNFAVRYWDADWQKTIFGGPESLLERIIGAGFDGVFIDRIDAYNAVTNQRPTAEKEMADFVIALARHARNINPGFIIVPQNAEELLRRKDYLSQIDAIAKEDLFYGGHALDLPNSLLQTNASLTWLNKARAHKRPVLVIEYLDNPKLEAIAQKKISRRGFIGYFGPRQLDALKRQPAKSAPPADPDAAAPATGSATAE